MIITVCYFARFREKLAVQQEQLELVQACTVEQVLQLLAQRGGVWDELFGCPKGVLAAINQDLSHLQATVQAGDELALFPPVTGG
jgi:molybdopterin synthase sulfur carrier subunit